MLTTRSGLTKLIAVTALGVALAACGGDDAPATDTGGGSGGGNRAPTISGSPQTSVMENQQYSFTPSAQDADGDSLTFSIQNRPAWASFNPATGELSGMPTDSDVGLYSNIRISVSDGQASANLGVFSVQVVSTAPGSATLSWTPPDQNTDGSPLPPRDIAAFRLYWGTSEGTYTNSVTVEGTGVLTYVVEPLTPGRYYFVATAINTVGQESSYSNMASKTVM